MHSRNRWLVAILFSAWIWSSCAGSLAAANWYLDKDARGANSGTSWTDAWTTVSAISWNSIASGDTLWVQGGDYLEHLDIFNKTGVTVRIAPNARSKAVFLGGQLYNVKNSVIDGWLNDTQYIVFSATTSHGTNGYLIRETYDTTVRGIEVHRMNDYIYDTTQNHLIAVNGNVLRVTFDRCYLHHTTGDGISLIAQPPDPGRFDNFVIINCIITDVGDDGIQAGANVGITIVDNLIDNNGFPTYFGGHPDGVQINPGGKYILIAGNTIRGFNQNIFVEWALAEIYLYNNILIGFRTSGTDRGMNISSKDTFSGSWVMTNNVFYNFVSFLAINGVLPQAPVVGNNIFVNCRYIISSVGTAFLDGSNIYWDEPGVVYYNTDGAAVGTPSERNAGGSRYQDPRFIGAGEGNFRLRSGSPAIDTGRDFRPYFNVDKDGNVRGDAWDVGAYEYPNGSNSTAPTPPRNLRTVSIN